MDIDEIIETLEAHEHFLSVNEMNQQARTIRGLISALKDHK